MSDESQKLFEAFIEQHADSRVIAISHHIESLIDDIMKLERRASELAGRGIPFCLGSLEWCLRSQPL